MENQEQKEEQKEDSNEKVQCKGCYKHYVSQTGLLQHIERSPLCAKWISILQQDDIFSNQIQNMYDTSNSKFHGTTCFSCNIKYSNLGNLNKHLENNPVCKKIMDYQNKLKFNKSKDLYKLEFINKMEISQGITWNNDTIINGYNTKEIHYAPAPVSNNSKLIHIIWNVFLTDKTQVKDLDKEIIDNNIGFIICILPDKNIYEEIKPKNEIEHEIINYEGHNPIITNDMLEKFENCYNKIEELQQKRKNTLIFCNNGYQRSLPFICKYLISRHKDEVQNIDKAIEIVLFQADKQNYATIKSYVKENLLMLKTENMKNFL